LIELLIVVAIIAILAAIAIPNFLAAQIRSKVSRVRAELRTVATALECYYVDYNVYPYNTGYLPRPNYANESNSIISDALTTPIAYLTSVSFKDPFVQPGTTPDEAYYTYQNIDQYLTQISPSSLYWPVARQIYGPWRMCSIGPDCTFSTAASPPTIQYDPSNGTVSMGNIWIGQTGANPPTGPIYNGL
jgi:Tfp pilus assembly protein PilE